MTPRCLSLVGTRRTVATADCTTDKAHVRDLMHLYGTWNITRKAKVILRYSVMCNEPVLIICFNFDHGKYIYIYIFQSGQRVKRMTIFTAYFQIFSGRMFYWLEIWKNTVFGMLLSDNKVFFVLFFHS